MGGSFTQKTYSCQVMQACQAVIWHRSCICAEACCVISCWTAFSCLLSCCCNSWGLGLLISLLLGSCVSK